MKNSFTTPYYHIDETLLKKDMNLLSDSLKQNWGDNFVCGYSVKTNSLPWLLTYLKKAGFYAEIVSETEYELVKQLGFDESHMIYNGPIKGQETFNRFLLTDAYLNMDSMDELNYLEELSSQYPDRKFSVGLRVNYDIENDCPGETMMGKTGGRFGYCYENGELKKVIDRIQALPNVTIGGLHMHSSSQLRTLHIFEALAGAACKIVEEYKLALTYVDMGGGYYGGVPDKPNYGDYFPVICNKLKSTLDPGKTTLLVEPGVSLISAATTFVTSVKDIKDVRGIRYVVTDGSRLNLNPQVTRHVYPHHLNRIASNEGSDSNCPNSNSIFSDSSKKVIPSQWICGFTCMEYDRLFEVTDEKELLCGDEIIYDLAGGYTMCLNPLFIRYLPPVYIRHEDGSYFTAREQWGVSEYLQKNYTE